VSKDLNGIVQTWNAGAERVFGYSAAEVIGRSITIIIPEDRLDEEAEVIRRIRLGQTVDHYETVRRHKNGGPIEISLTVSPIRDAGGRIIGASKIARDITERKRLERMAQEASRAKDEFLAVLSHELRTPLNTVLGYTAMLREGMLGEDQRTKALEIVGRNAEILSQLVNDVLDASRIVTGKLQLKIERCDVAAIASDVAEGLALAVSSKRLTLDRRIDGEHLVNGDEGRIRQILWNILSNAVKFTPAGGRITLTVASDDESVRAIVEDTGIGIAPGTLDLVFARFWQADASHARQLSGLGLGLALAQQFAELHGGTITARSAGVGKGATFELVLPKSA
jgi:PAS domain S-box-containing protein